MQTLFGQIFWVFHTVRYGAILAEDAIGSEDAFDEIVPDG